MMEIAERFLKAGEEWANEAGAIAVTTSREQYLEGQALNRRTGLLQNRIYARKLAGAAFKFGTNLKYGICWEQGWDHPTIITPKKKKCLAWGTHIGNRIVKDRKTGMYKKGKKIYADMIFTKRVVLPPQKARPFLKPALDQSIPEMKQLADRIYQDVFNRLPNHTIEIDT